MTVDFNELLEAYEWASAGAQFDASAHVSKATGRIFMTSPELEQEEELPDDLDNEALYLVVPDKRDLDLGYRLALRFAEEHLPDSYERVADIFSKRGAYARFKDLLEGQGWLDAWYRFEADAVERALREWCSQNGLEVRD